MANKKKNFPDEKFCKAALDSLKAYRYIGLTIKFIELNKIKIGKKRNLPEMWNAIEKWLQNGDISRCIKLLKYTDNLRMWGRQRVFLFIINGTPEERQKYLRDLSNPDFIRKKVGDILDNAIYRWDAAEPFLADVYYDDEHKSHPKLLILKLIETRKFKVSEGMEVKVFEKRSTNFFIIHLEEGFAQLILEQLPTGAIKDINKERQLFEEEIDKYLDFKMFSPITLETVMVKMLLSPSYPITYSGFKPGDKEIPDVSTLMIILNHLFRNPIPNQLSAYWECQQNLVGKSKLYFNLNGNNNCITFDGVADPNRIQDILKRFVDIFIGVETRDPSLFARGWVHRPYKNLQGQPRAQAVILAAGAIAASIIWILIEGLGNYIFEDWTEKTLKGIPLVVFTIIIDFLWIWFYYGWRRIKRSFSALWKMKFSEIFQLIRKSKEVVNNNNIRLK